MGVGVLDMGQPRQQTFVQHSTSIQLSVQRHGTSLQLSGLWLPLNAMQLMPHAGSS